MYRFALGVEYDGAGYCGWQKQVSINLETVQGKLEEALSRVANYSIRTTCAGRTDSGVHATNQVVHFDTPVDRGNKAWIVGVNSLLPPSIRVTWVKAVDQSFHARFSATARRYKYLIYCQRVESVFLRKKAVWIKEELDLKLMNDATGVLLGEHDFSGFRAAGCQSRSSRRFVMEASWYRSREFTVFDVKANAFLLHMVRNLVGAFLDVGNGAKDVNWISEVLGGRDRSAGSVTAPPDGLYLVAVDYPDLHMLPTGMSTPLFLP